MSKPIGLSTRRALLSSGLGALFVLCWSSGFIGAKLGASDAAVTTVLMWRFLPLALALAPILLSRGTRASLSRAELGRQLVIGALSQSGYLLTVYWAIGLGVSTGTTALIDGIQPLVMAALVGPLLGVAVSGRQWIGLMLGLVGVIVVTWADAASPATSAPLWAYAVPFLGMLSLVLATLLERRSKTALPPLRALAIHCTTSAVVFTALALATGTAVPPLDGVVLGRAELADRPVHVRRVRPVLVSAAPHRGDARQLPDVPGPPGDGALGCRHVRRAARRRHDHGHRRRACRHLARHAGPDAGGGRR
ncbi:DMT family transporter [Microbacterium marinilacus]|uniref:EamA domain-containing protein n=1 Tax=Microbacterium marinilacus TaxID=415209 RepID=A0ABP7BHY0_9MICO|nr:DMT family transporter [Microbacterium marinilacus]MBY0689513.1 DMT family transporter [Microbacterium marinilacus]